jgi:glycosyltransferase involved in cell wall biosynthesis
MQDSAAQVSVALPPDARPDGLGFPVEPVGKLTGNSWEQLSLPLGVRGRFLISLASRSPMFLRNGVTMVHDAQVFTTPSSYSFSFRTTLKINTRLAGRLQRGILTVSEFAKGELAALGIAPAERIHVIYNGVDHVLQVPPEDDILTRLSIAPRRFALGLANIRTHKNIGLLLRAFARPEMADQTLVLAGLATAQKFIDLGYPVPPNVIFAGYVSDGEMRSLQTHALAVCMPSLTEGFGLPPVEGMLLGTPAVIAPCGALPEVCGPGALQADPHDPQAWAAALLRLRHEPETWQGLADAGQDWAKQFTWAAAAEKLQTILEKIR